MPDIIHPTGIYTAAEVADYMHVSRERVYGWMHEGQLPNFSPSRMRGATRYTRGSDILTMIDTMIEEQNERSDTEWRDRRRGTRTT